MRHRTPAAILVCSLILASTTWIQHAPIHRVVPNKLDEDLLYLPNEHLIVNFTGGLSGAMADLMWIRTIGYAAREFDSADKKFLWLEEMLRAVTRLDPYYEDAYSGGGMILSALGQDARGLALLQEGLINCPDSFNIVLEIVSVYMLNRHREPGAIDVMLRYVPLLAANSDHPDYYLHWMDRIRANHSLQGETRMVWADLLESTTDEFIRDLARQRLDVLDAEDAVAALNGAIGPFRSKFGRPPATVSELIESGLAAAPDLSGRIGTFYVDPEGAIRNSFLDTKVIERSLRNYQTALERYKREFGDYPDTLDALNSDAKSKSSAHPLPGHRWKYDPETGAIEDVPPAPVRP